MDIKPTELAAASGISVSYASELLSGVRHPSRKLAIRIFDDTSIQLGPIAGLSEAEIAVARKMERS